ncbi:MAG: type II toxin-antitoxin system RelE/ParE family toxin [Gallionella sp.]|nr:type II toxin-antitoxin system RelE/ParE family toxin [Gallionella sp.]
MHLYFSTAARQELDDAFEYLELQQLGFGYRFTSDVDDALARIRNQPLAWHPLGKHLRRCHLKHFRYGVIYRIREEQAEILAIAHDSRRPGYWRNRKT